MLRWINIFSSKFLARVYWLRLVLSSISSRSAISPGSCTRCAVEYTIVRPWSACSTGAGSVSVQLPAFYNNILGTKFKIIMGYKSSEELNLALDRDEVQARSFGYSSIVSQHPDWLKTGKVRFIAQIGSKRLHDLPDNPLQVPVQRLCSPLPEPHARTSGPAGRRPARPAMRPAQSCRLRQRGFFYALRFGRAKRADFALQLRCRGAEHERGEAREQRRRRHDRDDRGDAADELRAERQFRAGDPRAQHRLADHRLVVDEEHPLGLEARPRRLRHPERALQVLGPGRPAQADLRPGAPLSMSMEPPGLALHRWMPASGLVTHVSYIGEFGGARPSR